MIHQIYEPPMAPTEAQKQKPWEHAQAMRVHVRCDQCVWFELNPRDEDEPDRSSPLHGGWCHQNPPVFDNDPTNPGFLWPWVRGKDFCSNFLSPANYGGLGDTAVFLRRR